MQFQSLTPTTLDDLTVLLLHRFSWKCVTLDKTSIRTDKTPIGWIGFTEMFHLVLSTNLQILKSGI